MFLNTAPAPFSLPKPGQSNAPMPTQPTPFNHQQRPPVFGHNLPIGLRGQPQQGGQPQQQGGQNPLMSQMEKLKQQLEQQNSSQQQANPYQTQAQTQQQPQQQQQFARGGSARSKMVMAHFNPKELNVLDHLQGKTECCKKTGIRSYSDLEHLLKNPHIAKAVHHHVRAHRAAGGPLRYGTPELEHLANEGRHGDTELALIGPHTHNMLNRLAGGPTRNPETGHPEYWSLGDALGGMWDGIKSVGSKVWDGTKAVGRAVSPALMPLAQGALSAMGPWGMAGAAALPGLSKAVFGESGENENPALQAAGQGLAQGIQSYQGGMDPSKAAGLGLAKAGRKYGGGWGAAAQGAGQALQQGQSGSHAVAQGLQSGLNYNMPPQGGAKPLGLQAPQQQKAKKGHQQRVKNAYVPNAPGNQSQAYAQQNMEDMAALPGGGY